MGVSQWLHAIDAVAGLVRFGAGMRRGAGKGLDRASTGAGPLDARLAGVVVAALKEAFERDRARTDLEREQIESERRRAERALQAELQRQAADRTAGQLRLIAVMAAATWMVSAVLAVWLPGIAGVVSRLLLGGGWLCAFASLGCALGGWPHVGNPASAPTPRLAQAARWLLLAGMTLVAAALLLAMGS